MIKGIKWYCKHAIYQFNTSLFFDKFGLSFGLNFHKKNNSRLRQVIRSVYVLGICLLFFCNVFAQQATSGGTYKIKGRVVDSNSRKAIDYAAVTVFLTGSTTVAGGMITDDNGYFTIDNLGAGEYIAKVDYIGYSPKTTTGIILSDKHMLVNMGNIPIVSASKSLGTVTVTGTRNFIENKLDKLVYNVEKDISSQSGVATDVLKKVPMVGVDMDGNVDLLGDKNVRVFINGKPSAMFDNNLADALKAIPANMIKTIEVITSPGAQYDAQGTGGIINIILKDNKAKGMNGNVNLSGGSRYENGSVNLHVKNGSLDLNASLSGNMQLDTKSLFNSDRKADSAGIQQNELIQNGYSSYQRDGYRAQAGFDWAITKSDNISGSTSYNNYGNTGIGGVPQWLINDLVMPYDTTATARNTKSHYRYMGEDWNLNYKRKFAKEGHEFSFVYQGSIGGSGYTYQLDQSYQMNDKLFAGAKATNGFKDLENNFYADYANPITKDIVLNTGMKTNISNITSNSDHDTLNVPSGLFMKDPALNNTFNFNRYIYSAYASLGFPLFKKLSAKIGIRDEYTSNFTPGDTVKIPSYNFITPSGMISRTLKGNQTVKFNYSRRLQRPGYGQYNPFIEASDPTNLSKGNPGLAAQKMHWFELSYFKPWDKGSNIYVSVFYRYSVDDWQGFSSYFSSYKVGDTVYKNVTLNTTINAGNQQSGGLNISGNWVVNDKLQIRPNMSLFYRKITSSFVPGGSINNGSYRMSTNVAYQCTKNLAAEFFCNYNSVRYEIQGKNPSFFYYSFSVRQQFLDKKASLSFSTTNPFNMYTDQVSYVTASNFTSMNDKRYPNRLFTLSFSYKFGKIEYVENKVEEEPQTPN